jgi:hypothetical protein
LRPFSSFYWHATSRAKIQEVVLALDAYDKLTRR